MFVASKQIKLPPPPVWCAVGNPFGDRYNRVGQLFAPIMSDIGLNGFRWWIEWQWVKRFIKTCKPEYNTRRIMSVIEKYQNMFNEEIYLHMKEVEKRANHDVKAVEYSIDYFLEKEGLSELTPFIHIGATSEDITNLAYAMMWREALEDVLLPKMKEHIDTLAEFTREYKALPMMSHTHGQPASPTTVGKEFGNFLNSFMGFYQKLKAVKITGKFNGAVGNFSAMTIAAEEYDWEEVSRILITEDIGLTMRDMTTQVEPCEYMVEICNIFYQWVLKLQKLDTDAWLYIAFGMLAQRVVKGEVGSSTMPHKINPIKFENSESFCRMLRRRLSEFCEAISDSRMQRDLANSAALRFGIEIFEMLYQAVTQTIAGLGRISPNEKVLAKQLEENPAVLAEAIQTVMRYEGIPGAYEAMKDLTRGEEITLEDLHKFIRKTEISDLNKEKLLALTPDKYIGKAVQLTEACLANYEVLFAEAAR